MPRKSVVLMAQFHCLGRGPAGSLAATPPSKRHGLSLILSKHRQVNLAVDLFFGVKKR